MVEVHGDRPIPLLHPGALRVGPPSTYSMVHVMSEVIEESFAYRLEALGQIDRCDVACGSYGDKFHRWDDAGPFVEYEDHMKHISFYSAELDTQRLRADTAEAELIIANADKEAYAQNAIDLREQVELWKGRTTNLTHARSVAEQRIADLIELLRGAWKYADHDLNVVTVNRELAARIEAALNKKSEGESHE